MSYEKLFAPQLCSASVEVLMHIFHKFVLCLIVVRVTAFISPKCAISLLNLIYQEIKFLTNITFRITKRKTARLPTVITSNYCFGQNAELE